MTPEVSVGSQRTSLGTGQKITCLLNVELCCDIRVGLPGFAESSHAAQEFGDSS